MKRAILLVALVAGLLAIPTTALAVPLPPDGVLGGTITSVGGSLTVTVLEGSAGFTSTIYLDAPYEEKIATAANNPTHLNIGQDFGLSNSVPAGEELVFRIAVQQNSESWFTGAGSRNVDGEAHAYVKENGPGDWTVWFEDLNKNAPWDQDFKDAVFRVVQRCDPEVAGDCTTEDGNGSEAEVECDDCSPIVVTPETATGGDNAQFNVGTVDNAKGTTFEMVVTMGSKSLSTPPGKAEVEMDPDTGSPFIMPKCKKSSDTDCVVQIKRVKGGLTQYTLRFDSDPRFRFR